MSLSRRILFISSSWLALHIFTCTLAYNFEPTRYFFGVESIFRFWDAAHYTNITLNGYSGNLWAFYPLYPFLVKVFAFLTGLQDRPDIAGAILSTLLISAFCLIQSKLSVSTDISLRCLIPESQNGWILFLFSPASYIFHTNHTESLFLLLSFSALWASRCKNWRLAASLAGLSALSRNQGVFVAVTIALYSSWHRKPWKERIWIFSFSGIISLLLLYAIP